MGEGNVYVVLVVLFGVSICQEGQQPPPPPDVIDVALSCPPRDAAALLALLKSISVNMNPQKVRTWIFSEMEDVTTFKSLLSQHGRFYPRKNLRILGFEHNGELSEILSRTEDTKDTPFSWDMYQTQRNSTSNSNKLHPFEIVSYNSSIVSRYDYVRYYMPHLFLKLSQEIRPKKYLYLDCDSIVLGNLLDIYQETEGLIGSGICLASARRDFPLLQHYVTSFVLTSIGFQQRTPAFDTGMMFIDIDCWIETRILEKILFWVDLRQRRVLFLKGVSPPLLLSFYPLTAKARENYKSAKYPRPVPMLFIRERWALPARDFTLHCTDIEKSVGLCPAVVRYMGNKKPWMNTLSNENQQKTFDTYAPPALLPRSRPSISSDLPYGSLKEIDEQYEREMQEEREEREKEFGERENKQEGRVFYGDEIKKELKKRKRKERRAKEEEERRRKEEWSWWGKE